jgi:predicted metalloprotease
MKWRGRQGSSNVEDQRGGRGSRGRMGGLRIGGKSLGCGSLIVIIILVMLGVDPMALLQSGAIDTTVQTEQPQPYEAQSQEEADLAQFVSVVLKDTEDVWNTIFRDQLGRQYVEPTLVIFDFQVKSACGMASSATGPFYCPGDQKLYIDLSFYRELSQKFGAPGDFAMAYVVAHEVAHHVQNLLGYTSKVSSQRGRVSETDYNQLSVRLELQADFLAGVWAHHADQTKRILEEGDVEEAISCANVIGDDRIQKQARGYVVPDSFTHGTSEQRVRWFKKGIQTGNISQGDTFNTRNL